MISPWPSTSRKTTRGPITIAARFISPQGQPEQALEDFSKAIELDSHFADPYSNRGR